LSGFVKRAREALDIPELKYGAKGMVQLEDGTWVTPADKQKRFEDRMKAEGRTLYAPTGAWLTADEIQTAKGYVQYVGPSGTAQWVTKEEYDKLMAAATAAAHRLRPDHHHAPSPASAGHRLEFRPHLHALDDRRFPVRQSWLVQRPLGQGS